MKRKDLLEIIENGESLSCEFKRKFSTHEKIAKEMIAFANTNGGVMLFGVDDNKEIVGVDSEKTEVELVKGEDGLLRTKSGESLPLDASVQVASGTLEGSNVSAVGALVNMIELSRQFEMQVKMMRTAEDNDRRSQQLLTIS